MAETTHKVCIDIGHGINTYPPSKGTGDFAEFTFNNAVGKKAKELAEINGFEVMLTQPFDSDEIPLYERTAKIKVDGCDMGISIHANASSNTAVSGHEFWYWHTRDSSMRLATILDANSIALLPNKRRGLKISKPRTGINFAMCREPKMPFVIGEFGFFTNEYERENLLKDEAFQYKCAKVIVKSFCDYAKKPFTVFDYRAKEPVKIPQWKLEGLQNLFKDGFVKDYEGWLDKLDEPAPTWMVFTVLDRLNQELKKK